MLFKTIPREEFRTLVEILFGSCEVIAPRCIGRDKRGDPIHQYLPVDSFEDIDLKYETTEYSAKTYFLPFRETLSTFDFHDADWEQSIRYHSEPRAIVGLHACDINALLKLDKVLARDLFPSPYYITRRKNTLVVGIDHDPCKGAFCHSLGTDTVNQGFDLFLTDIGPRYFVAIGSDRGFNLITKLAAKEVTEEDTRDYVAERKRISQAFKDRLPVRNLENLLDIEFESKVWSKWGEKCLSCGSCAMVCPTCYCYGITEQITMDFRRSKKVKQLYSCNLVDFAQVAGGHNFRPKPEIRLKYRYYHQHHGFIESYDEPKCVGCNRCGRTCIAGINPQDVLCDLQMEGKS